MIVYAPSYAGLVQALKIVRIEELVVYSPNKLIVDFCNEQNIKNKYLKWIKKSGWREVKQSTFLVTEFAKTIVNQKVLFCFYGFDLLGLEFIYQIKDRNEIYFLNKDHIHKELKLKDFLFDRKWILDFLIYKYYFKFPISLFSNDGVRRFFGVQPQTLESIFSPLPVTLETEIFEFNKSEIIKKLNIISNAVIFIDQGSSSFIVNDEIVNWLDSNFKNDLIYVKPHPNGYLSSESLKKFKFLPTETPMELLPVKSSVLIGICSTSLLDRDNQCKKYSLINLVKWRNPDTYQKYLNSVKKHPEIIIV